MIPSSGGVLKAAYSIEDAATVAIEAFRALKTAELDALRAANAAVQEPQVVVAAEVALSFRAGIDGGEPVPPEVWIFLLERFFRWRFELGPAMGPAFNHATFSPSNCGPVKIQNALTSAY